MNNLHNRLKDNFDSSKKGKNGRPIEFGPAQVLDIVFLCWFLVDEVQHIEMDSEEAFGGDV
jgi:hypothetical protein